MDKIHHQLNNSIFPNPSNAKKVQCELNPLEIKSKDNNVKFQH